MRRSFILPLLAFCAFFVFHAATALAVPAAWERVDVTVHSEDSGEMMLVSGHLPDATPLPAEAVLSVPAGAQIQWLGEILGGAPSADPELGRSKSTRGGADLYTFKLTKARIAQAEMPTKGSIAFDGQKYDANVNWVSATAVPEVRLSVRVPQGAQVLKPAAGATAQSADGGDVYYTKTVKNVKAGDRLGLAMSYRVPAAPPAPAAAAPSSGSSTLAAVVFMLILLAVLVGLGVAVRRRMVGSRPSDLAAPALVEGEDASADPAHAESSDEGSDGVPQTGGGGLAGFARRNAIAVVVVALLALGAAFAGFETTRPKMTGDTVTRVFSQGQPCATATIPLTLSPGADPMATGEALFGALKPLQGLTTAVLDVRTASLQVGYCESSGSEATIRQALAPTGLVAQGGSTAAPTQNAVAPAANGAQGQQ